VQSIDGEEVVGGRPNQKWSLLLIGQQNCFSEGIHRTVGHMQSHFRFHVWTSKKELQGRGVQTKLFVLRLPTVRKGKDNQQIIDDKLNCLRVREFVFLRKRCGDSERQRRIETESRKDLPEAKLRRPLERFDERKHHHRTGSDAC
jgi:hypothetical protein